jgi:N-acetylmuramoyl-L-alanine amidase
MRFAKLLLLALPLSWWSCIPPKSALVPERGEKQEAATVPWPAVRVRHQIESWDLLSLYDGTLTRPEFERRLAAIFDPFGGLNPFLGITDQEVVLYGPPAAGMAQVFRLKFAPSPEAVRPVRPPYRTPEEYRKISKPPGRPLEGLRIAIDPGHIGGPWGRIENRSVRYKKSFPVQEGDFNIITARILREELSKRGASVFLVREDTEPVSPLRPPDFVDEAREIILKKSDRWTRRLAGLPPEEQNKRLGNTLIEMCEFLFYRSSEIFERGNKIRAQFQPDITLTLYINATETSGRGRLTHDNKNIFFVHGCYTKEETEDPRQQRRLFQKLLEYPLPIETAVAVEIAEAFKRRTGLPAVGYTDSKTTRTVVPGYKDVVARNLASNREYDGPVVVTEPYFMNNAVVYRRLLAGDYDGVRRFDQKEYPSIFREYADCVLEGILRCYAPPP